MERLTLNSFIGLLKKVPAQLLGSSSDEEYKISRGERIAAFVIAYMLAMILWMLVNLGRTFNLNQPMQVELNQPPAGMALASDVPDDIQVTFAGQGWSLLNIYNNPPSLNINPVDGQVDVAGVVREQMNNFPGVSVVRVDPTVIQMGLEENVSKMVPIRPQMRVDFQDRFNFSGSAILTPDSVLITGAKSVVEQSESWRTVAQVFNNVRDNIDVSVPLQPPGQFMNLQTVQTRYQAPVSEYTEGEVRLRIRTRNLPDGNQVTYSPSVITVKYDVPIDQYADAQDIVPFSAYVHFEDIESDSTGFVTPLISSRDNALNIRLRSYQPRRVAYYKVGSK